MNCINPISAFKKIKSLPGVTPVLKGVGTLGGRAITVYNAAGIPLHIFGPVFCGGRCAYKSVDDAFQGIRSIFSRDGEGIREGFSRTISNSGAVVYNGVGVIASLHRLGVISFSYMGALPVIGALASIYNITEMSLDFRSYRRVKKLFDDLTNSMNEMGSVQELKGHKAGWLRRRGISKSYRNRIQECDNQNDSEKLVKDIIARLKRQRRCQLIGLSTHILGLFALGCFTVGALVPNPVVGTTLMIGGFALSVTSLSISTYNLYYRVRYIYL